MIRCKPIIILLFLSTLLVLDHFFHLGETCLSPFQLGETCISARWDMYFSFVRRVSAWWDMSHLFQLGETCVSHFSIPGSNTAQHYPAHWWWHFNNNASKTSLPLYLWQRSGRLPTRLGKQSGLFYPGCEGLQGRYSRRIHSPAQAGSGTRTQAASKTHPESGDSRIASAYLNHSGRKHVYIHMWQLWSQYIS